MTSGLPLPSDGLREVACAFERGRHPELVEAARDALPIVFLAPVEEQLVPAAVESGLGNQHRAADVVPEVVVPILGLLGPVLIGKPAVRVQRLVPGEVATAAVEVARAALRGHDELPAARLAELGLIVRGEDLHLGHRVRVQRDVRAAVVARIDVRGAVNRELVLVGARAVHVEGIDAAGAGDLAVEGADDRQARLSRSRGCCGRSARGCSTGCR